MNRKVYALKWHVGLVLGLAARLGQGLSLKPKNVHGFISD